MSSILRSSRRRTTVAPQRRLDGLPLRQRLFLVRGVVG
jgi:hypothetical protein